MDYEKLIVRAKCPKIQNCPLDNFPTCKECQRNIDKELIDAIVALLAEVKKIKRERDAAISDIEALMWYSGDGCDICTHAVEVHKETYVRLNCALGKGCDCNPKWRGPKED